ncbi:MAG: hypothetical protein KC731_36070, partial [Myxococcales bacterium]|nr:hypothetical protein [Myxococcales bacterium]
MLVDVALAFGQETQPAEAWWDGVEATIRALSATARIGVIGDCAALAARLDASRYYDLAKSLGLDDLTLGRCAPALVVELMQISKPMATPPGSEVAQALMACVRASRGEDLFAELAALAQAHGALMHV